MLDTKLIRPSSSPWTSPVVLVRKKNGKLRFCVDYRKLNGITKKDAYPLPRIDDMLNTLKGSKWFSTLDLASGYWQVAMHPRDREKTAFVTRYGIYEFNVMPFGLCNAPATFQRLMDRVYQDIAWKFVVVYLDDTIVYSKSFDEHLEHLRETFIRIRQAGLRLNLEKCNFWMQSLPFLGHIVTSIGIAPDPQKIEAVQKIQPPKTVTQLRSFLGLVGYYRQFIRDFSKIA
jgi:Reverse transcriptase (RNA-dependent DNA polymerase)